MSRVLISLLAALTLSGPALAQTRDLSTSGASLDRVVAIVNDGVVLQSQVDDQINLIMGRLRDQKAQMPPADVVRQQVLERLVLQEIQLQRANRLGVQVSDEMLNEALRDVALHVDLRALGLPGARTAQVLGPDMKTASVGVDDGRIRLPEVGLWTLVALRAP